MTTHRRLGGWMLGIALLAACTPTTSSDGSSGTVPLSTSGTASATGSSTSVSPTPQTPLGLATGPGVTDSTITVGLIVDPTVDLGFSAGVRLWQQVVNTSGGLCGRTVELVDGTGYSELAPTAAALVVATQEDQAQDIGAGAAADGVPVLTDTSAEVRAGSGIIPVGATSDVLVINSLDHLASVDVLPEGATIGVVSDGSDSAAAALDGVRWWAQRHRALVTPVRSSPATWGDAEVVVAWNSVDSVRDALDHSGPQTVVLTDLRGFDRALGSDRVRIATVTPAFGSDQPAAAMVAATATTAGVTEPGPRLTAGYAVAGQVARLVLRACEQLDLTRPGLVQALVEVGPTAPDSLLGPSDPAAPTTGTGPATLLSAMATADPSAPGGLRPLTWMIEDPSLVERYPS